MNRFKKELAKRGYKITTDINYEPYVARNIDEISVNASTVTHTTYCKYQIVYLVFDRSMQATRTFKRI